MLRFKRHLSETARVISSDYFIHTHTHTHTHTRARASVLFFARGFASKCFTQKRKKINHDRGRRRRRRSSRTRVVFLTKRLRRLSSPSHRLVRKRTRTMRSSPNRGVSVDREPTSLISRKNHSSSVVTKRAARWHARSTRRIEKANTHPRFPNESTDETYNSSPWQSGCKRSLKRRRRPPGVG